MAETRDPARIAALLEHAALQVDPALPAEVARGVEEVTGRPPGEGTGTGPVVHIGPTLPDALRADGSRLLWVHSTNAGVDTMLAPGSPWPEGVLLTRTVGRMGERIGQYVLAWALADCQDVRGFLGQHAERAWRRLPTELATGHRAVVFGTGHIGAGVAAALQRCGIATTGVARTARETPGFETVLPLDAPELPRILAASRWIVNALPLTPATRGLFGSRLLSAADGATFINVGRGGSVATDALARALETGHLGAAVLDALPEEPTPPDSPLWDLPRTVITSHSAGITTPSDIVTDFRTSWAALTTGHLPPLTVHPASGY